MLVQSAQTETKPTVAGATPTPTPPPAPSLVPPVVTTPADSASAVAVPAPTETKTPEPTKPEEFPKSLAIIARREKAVTEREKALKTAEPELKQFREFQKAVKEGKRLDALKLVGVSYEDLTTDALAATAADDPAAQVKALKEKIEQLEGKKKEETETSAHEQKVSEARQVIDVFKGQVKSHIEANKDKYPLVHDGNYQDDVFQVIDEHHAKHGVLLTIDQAAAAVETYVESEARKLISHPKFKSATSTPESTSAPKPEHTKQAPTLTQAATPANSSQDMSKLSKNERLQQIASKYTFYKD